MRKCILKTGKKIKKQINDLGRDGCGVCWEETKKFEKIWEDMDVARMMDVQKKSNYIFIY